jgi:predicted amidophosphoribosyltransferase
MIFSFFCFCGCGSKLPFFSDLTYRCLLLLPFLFICYACMMTIEDIALLCEERSVRWTDHILQRIFRRGIRMDDIIDALTNGEIIE